MDYYWKQEWTVPTVVGVISFGIGVGVGYGIQAIRRNKEIDDAAYSSDELSESESDEVDAAIEQFREIFASETRRAVRQFNNMIVRLTEAVEGEEHVEEPSIDEIARDLHASVVDHTSEEGEQMRIFITDDDWDFAEEAKRRDPSKPYQIHWREFEQDEMEFGHITITYYAGDDVLCDDEGTPIYNYGELVGKLEFGKGTADDPNVCYVRNEHVGSEFEVIREEGSYFVEVLGGDPADGIGQVT